MAVPTMQGNNQHVRSLAQGHLARWSPGIEPATFVLPDNHSYLLTMDVLLVTVHTVTAMLYSPTSRYRFIVARWLATSWLCAKNSLFLTVDALCLCSACPGLFCRLPICHLHTQPTLTVTEAQLCWLKTHQRCSTVQ